MTCTNAAHYPQHAHPEEYDPIITAPGGSSCGTGVWWWSMPRRASGRADDGA